MKTAIESVMTLAKMGLGLEREIARLKTLRDSMLGIEAGAKAEISKKLDTLEDQMRLFEVREKHPLGTRYHPLSINPLAWRDKDGRPQLAVFSPDSPEVRFSIKFVRTSSNSYDLEKEMRPKLPLDIARCYDDVFAGLREEAYRIHCTMSLSCVFGGTIPNDVRKKIGVARGEFKDVFVVAEPKVWSATPIPTGDPLVVGWDGERLWLIADFETTPVEEAMIF